MTDKPQTPAVIYAAKSTEDKRGSIETQLTDCRRLAVREGWEEVAAFTDEGFSAYRGNRGPGLARAKAALAKHAPCMLVVQHTDRLARGAGDEPGAADHLMELFFWLGRQRIELWAVQSGKVDRIRALLEGERNTEDSKRKSAATRDGLKRRRDRGQPVGAVPVGYAVEKRIVKEDVVTKRVIDTASRATVERVFDLIEAGHTPGQVSMTLNAEGARTVRGGHWTTRAVRRVVENEDYCGGTGYPPLIEQDRWQRINDALKHLDPATVQARKGGRPAGADFLLAGLAFCRACGAPMRCRRYRTGTRVYRCRNAMEGIGLCASRPVPADVAERHVLEHLNWFIGSVEGWLAEKVQERSHEQRRREGMLDRERGTLDELERSRERHLTQYRRLVEAGSNVAHLALEEVERIDREREAQRQVIEETEAVISEWTGAPDVDAALDYYNAIVGVIEGKVRTAKGVEEMNAALASVIAGMWLSVEGGTLRAEFQLRPLAYDTSTYALPQILSQDLAGQRMHFVSPTPDIPPGVEIIRSSGRGAELDHTPSCTSTRSARRSPGRRDPRP